MRGGRQTKGEEEGAREGGGVRSEWEGKVKMASEVVETATEPSPRLYPALSLSANTFVLAHSLSLSASFSPSLPFLLSSCFISPFAKSSNG